MKKLIFLLLSFLIIGLSFPITAYADIGPKPSVNIEFKGLEGEMYYATLLSRESSTGPYYAIRENESHRGFYTDGSEEADVFDKFAEYKDRDGFYFLQFLQDCSESHKLSWTYHPPQEFKILLYFPMTDTFVVSDEIYERYAFDSYYTADVSNQGINIAAQSEMAITKSYNYGKEILSLIIRIILTIAIELGIALLFGLRSRKVFTFIVIVNVITQIVLNVALSILNYYMGAMAFVFFYILLEIAVFIIEAIIYTIFLKNDAPKWKLILFAFVANTVSFVVGVLLGLFIPIIF